MMATGVARPRAQGQAITSTLMARSSEYARLPPANIHKTRTAAAIRIIAGTKIPETLSATRAIGAFVAAASLTI